MIDTHVHFGLSAPPDGVEGVLRRAVAAGVSRMVAIGGNATENERAFQLAAAHPALLRAAVGYDRECAGQPAPLEALQGLVAAPGSPVVALGELGLDFHYHPETRAEQQALMEGQLALARECRLPVVVHVREAEPEALALLGRHAAQWPGGPDRIGVIHCFTGNRESAGLFLDLGFHISFSGIVTFRNAVALRDTAQAVPDDRLLVETDSPFLAPVPHRGQPNEPAFLPAVVACLAAVRGGRVEDVGAVASRNAQSLFAWPAAGSKQ